MRTDKKTPYYARSIMHTINLLFLPVSVTEAVVNIEIALRGNEWLLKAVSFG